MPLAAPGNFSASGPARVAGWAPRAVFGPLASCLLLACGADPAEAPPWPEFEEGIPAPVDSANRALEFDGQRQYASLGTAGFPFALAPQTIALWVRPARLEGVQNLVVLRKDFESGVQLGLQEGIPMAWRVFGGRVYVSAAEALEVGVWTHVAYSFDGNEHRIYVDGVERGVGDVAPNNRTPTTGWLGSLDGRSGFFAGALDDVRIWAETKSAEQIAADASGADAHGAGLVANLPCDEPDGLRAYDHSGRSNHAALGDGVPLWAPGRVLR